MVIYILIIDFLIGLEVIPCAWYSLGKYIHTWATLSRGMWTPLPPSTCKEQVPSTLPLLQKGAGQPKNCQGGGQVSSQISLSLR